MIALRGAINHEMCIGEEVSLSPIIRQTFSILPQKLGMLLVVPEHGVQIKSEPLHYGSISSIKDLKYWKM